MVGMCKVHGRMVLNHVFVFRQTVVIFASTAKNLKYILQIKLPGYVEAGMAYSILVAVAVVIVIRTAPMIATTVSLVYPMVEPLRWSDPCSPPPIGLESSGAVASCSIAPGLSDLASSVCMFEFKAKTRSL